MVLVIDQGNSFIKFAVFSGNQLLDLRTYENISTEQLNNILDEFEDKNKTKTLDYGIFSSVVKDTREIVAYLNTRMKLIVMSSHCSVPISNKYKTPETLGNDRIAAVVGAVSIYPASNILTIDAGTCITYDFVRADKIYLGGGIAPGIDMRFKALHTFTSKLPLVCRESEVLLVGNSTTNSILSGVLNGIFAEVDGIIDRYKQHYPDLKIILIGGDANYFDRMLKNDIFAVPNLVLFGLNNILQYNVKI